MKKIIFLVLLLLLLVSLTVSVAMAGVDWEDPQPPGSASNGPGLDPIVTVPAGAACHGGFVGASC